MEFDEILPEILLGSCPNSIDDVQWLIQDHQITAVLNLQTDEDLDDWQIDWAELEQAYRNGNVSARRVPVTDFDHDDLRDRLPQCVQALDELIRDGRKVYVHCNAGINRSPSTVVAYLHWVRGLSLDEALQFVMRRRSCEPFVDAIQSSAGLDSESS